MRYPSFGRFCFLFRPKAMPTSVVRMFCADVGCVFNAQPDSGWSRHPHRRDSSLSCSHSFQTWTLGLCYFEKLAIFRLYSWSSIICLTTVVVSVFFNYYCLPNKVSILFRITSNSLVCVLCVRNCAKIIGGGDPLYLKFWIKVTALVWDRRFSIYFRS